MSQQPLHIPHDVYNLIRRAADASNRSVEEMLLDYIRIMYEDPDILLADDILEQFSDDNLWTVVYQRAARKEQKRANELIARSKESTLSEQEQSELDLLLGILDKAVVLRSKALALLNQRGYETAHLS